MAQIRVLIIDDEIGFSSVLAKRLGRREVDVSTASCGEEALHLLTQNTYHVAILDMNMPGMNGLQVLRAIKKDYPFVEVILLTGNADIKSAQASMNAGAFDFILKPADTEIISNKIIDAARISGQQNRI
ncbi:response regulator [Maridesulfovibrio salexigens]|uniref:Response regulator receiver protein n=1 Tax=Maridesulfovibrio salexigens (strain ATCC 14822 / DSM 2638 / NCIMB 8403 / VKM B-1763) TaxID=526222 RepID=C6BW52_MARSD|nr:response regulator [Maridesulfovibrio salexigens]ACS80255.1 response regulator receiver protein [Maridesulfovibrio salexigens DSM 2638]